MINCIRSVTFWVVLGALPLLRAAPLRVSSGTNWTTALVSQDLTGAQVLALYEPTFTTLLQAEVGDKYNVTFKTVGKAAYEFVAGALPIGSYDFLFTNSITAVCMQAIKAINLVTQRNTYNGTEFIYNGGIIFCLAARTDLLTLGDIEGKTMSVLYGDSGPLFTCEVANEAGYSCVLAPAMMMYSYSAMVIYSDIMSGVADFGVISTLDLQFFLEASLLTLDQIRVIDPYDTGDSTFPFETTTQLVGNWPVVAMPWVPEELSRAVASALLSITATDSVAIAGNYAGWDVPRDYTEVKDILTELGLMDSGGNCVSSAEVTAFYTAIVCPSGYALLNLDLLLAQCGSAGLTCPAYHLCVCTPCLKVDEERMQTRMQGGETACVKMDSCTSVQQLESVSVAVKDAWFSVISSLGLTASNWTELIVTTDNEVNCYLPPGVQMDCALSTRYGASSAVAKAAYDAIGFDSGGGEAFNYTLSFETVGLKLIEVVVDGSDTDSSPLLLTVVDRDCSSYGKGRTANSVGECVCEAPKHAQSGTTNCQEELGSATIAGICVGGIVLLGAAALAAQAYQRAKAEALWKIPASALQWPSPKIVLGRGTFGEVLQAHYRGVGVAIKQMHSAVEPDNKIGSQRQRLQKLGSTFGMGVQTLSSSVRYSTKRPAISPVETDMRDDSPAYQDMSIDNFGDEGLKMAIKVVEAPMEALEAQLEPSTPLASPSGSTRLLGSQMTFLPRSGGSFVGTLPVAASEGLALKSGVNLNANGATLSGGTKLGSIRRAFGFLWCGRRGGTLTFEEEIRLLSQLRHPNVTTVMGAVAEKGKPMLCVMELMDRGSLFDLLHNKSFPVELDMVVSVLHDMACGLTFLHESGVIHNDLKAQNVLIDRRFKAKLADLGLASYTFIKSAGKGAGKDSKDGKVRVSGDHKSGGGTKGGILAGTPYWIAPEKLRGEPCTSATDIYSAGITIFEALTRKEPYDDYMDPTDVLRQVADENRKDPHVMRPTIPSGVNFNKDLMQMMTESWSASAALRPSASELMQRLARLETANLTEAGGSGPDGTTLGELVRRRHAKTRRSVDNGEGAGRDSAEEEETPGDERAEDHLISGMPRKWARAIRQGRATEQEAIPHVCCVFTDIVGYSALSSKMNGEEVIDMLDRLYAEFDRILKTQHMYNVDIIGDAYMAVSGLLGEDKVTQVTRVATWAIEAIQSANRLPVCPRLPELGFINIRAGMHAGPCAAGVVGKLRPRFSLFGDTINVSARMESLSRENCAQMSAMAAEVLLAEAAGSAVTTGLRPRGAIAVKGKGTMETYFLTFEGCQDPFALDDHDCAGK